MSATEARRVWTLSASCSGWKCSRPIADDTGETRGYCFSEAFSYPSGCNAYAGQERNGRGELTCANDPLVVALPVKTASSLLDRLHDIVRDGTTLRTRHETSRTQSPREGRVPLKEGKHLGRRDELVRVDVSREDVVDQFLTAYDVGAGFSCGLGGLTGREHDEGGLLGRRGARVRQEDPPSEGVELDRTRGFGRYVDLVGCVGGRR